MANYDAIIVGGGHNGLVAAAYLSRAGKKVLVLEQRDTVGGIAVTEEFFPGFKVSTVAHLAGSFAPEIAGDLDLKSQGFELLPLDPLLFAPSPNGPSLLIADGGAASIAVLSKADAGRYEPFCALMKRLALFIRDLYNTPLPNKGDPRGFAAAELIKIGWKFNRLGKKDKYELLRILPMSAADLLNEWFENDLVKGAFGGCAMLASFVGPRQQGTAFNLLHHQLGSSNGALRTAGFVRGGMGSLTRAIAGAARRYGAEIRTGAEVVRIVVKGGAVSGVVLKNGDEIPGAAVISGIDAKRTFLKLVETTYLDPHFLLQVGNIRARGTVAKLNLALDTLPKFKTSSEGGSRPPGGIIHIGPTLDYLERAADDAKYGRISERPFLEITIPSIADPTLAPAGKHVMSVWMQSAPYHLRNSKWDDEQRRALAQNVINLLEDYAPGFKNSILHCQSLTPMDLERVYGLTGGHPYHAEMALDQLFFMRPVPGWSRYHTPIKHLLLCGSAAHPGGGITGLPGYFAARQLLKGRSITK